MAYAVRSPRSRVFGPSVYRGRRDRRSVAFTFDDGPSEATPEFLEILERFQARATFFQCGRNVQRLPGISRAVLAAGHEIGNHSHTHPLLSLRAPRVIREEFQDAQQAIAAATGFSPALLRAPYGVRWFGFREAQRRLRLLGVMWTVIGYDWRLPSEEIVSRIMRRLGNGAIICLHDGRLLQAGPNVRQTILALRRLLPMIRDLGYQLETVSQILCPTI